MIETHPFGHFTPPQPKLLILGSFPCLNKGNYGEWFYCGSGKSLFWQLLSDVFQHDLNDNESKKNLFRQQGIAYTDIALKIRRKKDNCSDANLDIIEYNRDVVESILNQGIERIFFTSRFVEKHFIKNFPDNKIPTTVLLSPSPAANLHISGLEEYKELKKKDSTMNPYKFRLLKYRNFFSQ